MGQMEYFSALITLSGCFITSEFWPISQLPFSSFWVMEPDSSVQVVLIFSNMIVCWQNIFCLLKWQRTSPPTPPSPPLFPQKKKRIINIIKNCTLCIICCISFFALVKQKRKRIFCYMLTNAFILITFLFMLFFLAAYNHAKRNAKADVCDGSCTSYQRRQET